MGAAGRPNPVHERAAGATRALLPLIALCAPERVVQGFGPSSNAVMTAKLVDQGLQISAVARTPLSQVSVWHPPMTRTFPFGRLAKVGRKRTTVVFALIRHVPVTAS